MSDIIQTNSDNIIKTDNFIIYANNFIIDADNFIIDKDNFIIDCVAHGTRKICPRGCISIPRGWRLCVCPISLDYVHKSDCILIDQQAYNKKILSEYIDFSYNNNTVPTIPHTRESFTEEILENINSKLNNKSEVIIKIINLLKFPEEIQKYLLKLDIKNK